MPGKFELNDNETLAEFLYGLAMDSAADDEGGDSEYPGYYWLFKKPIVRLTDPSWVHDECPRLIQLIKDNYVEEGKMANTLAKVWGKKLQSSAVVMRESSQGFITVDYYNTTAEAVRDFDKALEEYNNAGNEDEESEED